METHSASPAAPEPATYTFEVPSDVQAIESTVANLVARCRAAAFDGPRLTFNFRVGVTEALANAMLYGNRGDARIPVRVELSLDAMRVVVRVRDQGNGFDPSRVPDPTLDCNLDRPGGRGVFLLYKLMDEVRYNERGNEVQLVLDRTAARRQGVG